MKEPTKKLKKLAVRYAKLQRDYTRSTRTYVRDCEPMDPDDFWPALEHFAKEIQERKQYGGDAIKEAAHNTMIKLVNRLLTDEHLIQWLRCAKFLASYRYYANKLHLKCEDMPGVHKGDDSYGDWTDALPLAGRKVVEAILNDDLIKYSKVNTAIHYARPKLKKLIQDGENYVRMTLEDQVIERFAYACDREEQRQDRLAS